jgi:hypothetical protein
MIQGNLLMDSNKITGYRALGAPGGDTCTGPKYSKADNNTFRDNIVAFGEGSGLLIGENMQGTQVLNNVIMDVQNGGVQIKGNNPGNNTIQHNSFVVSKLDSTYDSINAECYDQNGNFVGSDYSHSDILKIIYSIMRTAWLVIGYCGFSIGEYPLRRAITTCSGARAIHLPGTGREHRSTILTISTPLANSLCLQMLLLEIIHLFRVVRAKERPAMAWIWA